MDRKDCTHRSLQRGDEETSSRRNVVSSSSTPPKQYAAAASSRKLPLQSTSSSRSQKLKRPKPVPAPPASLVSLLKTDKSVFDYFKSLQEYYTYEVEYWKNEAEYWKRRDGFFFFVDLPPKECQGRILPIRPSTRGSTPDRLGMNGS